METTSENIRQLLEMLDNPEAYTEQEIQDIINRDEDTRETYRMMVEAKRSSRQRLADQSVDVDAAWQRFNEIHQSKRHGFGWMKILCTAKRHSRAAASVIGILFVSGIAFAAIHMIRHNTGIQEPQPKEQTVRQQTVLADNVQSDTTILAESVVFNNVSLDSIAKGIAAWYHMDMDLQNEQACELRFHFIWKPNDSLQEVIEKLNMFEHVDMAIEDGKLIVR